MVVLFLSQSIPGAKTPDEKGDEKTFKSCMDGTVCEMGIQATIIEYNCEKSMANQDCKISVERFVV